MRQEWNLWVVGGDRRFAQLARLLSEEGHRVHTYALELGVQPQTDLSTDPSWDGIAQADGVILPLPMLGEDGRINSPLSQQHPQLEELLPRLSPHQLVLGGQVRSASRRLAQQLGLTIGDYLEQEELAVANAVPTAEGAIQIAMEQLPITLHGARVLLLGFGRIGQVLAPRLAALGATVTVAARRMDALAWARTMGLHTHPLDQLGGWMCSYDLVVNTVPAPLLGHRELTWLKEDCLVLDLASRPGGVDREAAHQLGRKVIWALSLPGKVAPHSAAAALRDTICHQLEVWSQRPGMESIEQSESGGR